MRVKSVLSWEGRTRNGRKLEEKAGKNIANVTNKDRYGGNLRVTFPRHSETAI